MRRPVGQVALSSCPQWMSSKGEGTVRSKSWRNWTVYMYPGHSAEALGVQVWASLLHPPPWVPLTTCSFSTPKAEAEQASPAAAKEVGALPPGGLELDPVHRRSAEGMLRCNRKDFQGAPRWGGHYNQGPSTVATWELLLPGPVCLCP